MRRPDVNSVPEASVAYVRPGLKPRVSIMFEAASAPGPPNHPKSFCAPCAAMLAPNATRAVRRAPSLKTFSSLSMHHVFPPSALCRRAACSTATPIRTSVVFSNVRFGIKALGIAKIELRNNFTHLHVVDLSGVAKLHQRVAFTLRQCFLRVADAFGLVLNGSIFGVRKKPQALLVSVANRRDVFVGQVLCYANAFQLVE